MQDLAQYVDEGFFGNVGVDGDAEYIKQLFDNIIKKNNLLNHIFSDSRDIEYSYERETPKEVLLKIYKKYDNLAKDIPIGTVIEVNQKHKVPLRFVRTDKVVKKWGAATLFKKMWSCEDKIGGTWGWRGFASSINVFKNVIYNADCITFSIDKNVTEGFFDNVTTDNMRYDKYIDAINRAVKKAKIDKNFRIFDSVFANYREFNALHPVGPGYTLSKSLMDEEKKIKARLNSIRHKLNKTYSDILEIIDAGTNISIWNSNSRYVVGIIKTKPRIGKATGILYEWNHYNYKYHFDGDVDDKNNIEPYDEPREFITLMCQYWKEGSKIIINGEYETTL